MEISLIKKEKFSFALFDNVYDQKELDKIWQEALFLCDEQKMMSPEKTGSATLANGNYVKKNYGVFLDQIYLDRSVSNYLQLYKKPFKKEVVDQFIENDYTFNLFRYTDKDTTLLSYYENNDYYAPHDDMCCYTYIFWLFKEPRKFEGGDLVFPDINETVTIANNRGILFPSWALHSVNEIKMQLTEPFSGEGRFSFTTFFTFKN